MRFVQCLWSPLDRIRVFYFLFALLAVAAAGASEAPIWLHKAHSDDIVYFTFASPARVERYDLAQDKWLPAIPFFTAPSAIAVDAGGMTVAFGINVRAFNLDGTPQALAYNASGNVRGLVQTPDYIVTSSPSYGYASMSTLRRSDGQLIATSGKNNFTVLADTLAISPGSRRVYGITRESYTVAAATFEENGDWPDAYYEFGPSGYPDSPASRVYLSPDEKFLITNDGDVFDPASLTYLASLGETASDGFIHDLAFQGPDTPVLLRGNRLVAYSNTFVESGSLSLAQPAQGLAIASGQVLVFFTDSSSASGIAVTKVPLSSFFIAIPDAPLDPDSLRFLPERIIAAGDDSFFLYSRKYRHLFRWSAISRSYTASYPLLGAPGHLAYSAALNRLYTGYKNGDIRQIKLDEGATTETEFTLLPGAVHGLQAAGDRIFSLSGGFYHPTGSLFDSTGLLLGSKDYFNAALDPVWNSADARLYMLYGNDYQVVLAQMFDVAGAFGAIETSAYDGQYGLLRLSSNDSSLLVGSGSIYSTSSLTRIGALANAITDAVSIDNRWHTIRSGGTQAQLQSWSQANQFERGLTLPGHPCRLFALSDGRLAAFTGTAPPTASTSLPYDTPGNTGSLIPSLIDLTGTGSVTNAPFLLNEPASILAYRGARAVFTVDAQGSGPLAYQWKHKGDPIRGATEATFSIPVVGDADEGAYTVTVSNAFGSLTRAIALTVLAPPPAPVITIHPHSQTILLSQPYAYISLYVVATSPSSLTTYQWFKNNEAIPGATSSVLTLYQYYYPNPVTFAIYGDYHVVVGNPGGSIPSEIARLTPPPAPSIIEDPHPTYALPGQNVVFTVVATSEDLTYQWRRNGHPISNGTQPSLEVSATDEALGDYDVVVRNFAGSAISQTATLARAAPPAITTQPASFAVSPRGDALFYVVASGTPEPVAYRWQRYSSTASTWIDIATDDDRFLGTGTPSLLIAKAGLGLNGLVVRCVVSNGFDPVAVSDAATLTVGATPSSFAFTLQPVDRTVAAGDSVTFAVATNSLTPPVYQWFHNGVRLPGETEPILVLSEVTAIDAGNYTVLAQNGGPAILSRPARLIVSHARPSIRPLANQVTALLGAPVELAVTASGLPVPTLVWRKGGAVLAGFDGPVLALDQVSVSDAGVYRVTATNAGGSASTTIRLIVRPPAPAVPSLDGLRQGTQLDQDISVDVVVPGLRYRTSGLPAGLTLDPVTGHLTGIVRARPGTYPIRFWTEIPGAKSDLVSLAVTVTRFPVWFVGSYESLAAGDPDASGLLHITVTASGEFTGSLRSSDSARSLAFKGRFSPVADALSASASLALPGGRSIELVIYQYQAEDSGDIETRFLAQTTGEDGFVTALFDGPSLRPGGLPAADWAGTYTMSLGAPRIRDQDYPTGEAPATPLPEGYGYATVTVAANGRLKAAGRLADGTSLTASLPVDRYRNYLWFSRPHASGQNFFAGGFGVSAAGEAAPRYSVAPDDGVFYWKKSPQGTAKAYPLGFEACQIEMRMEPWTAPTRSINLAARLGVADTPASLLPVVTLAGLNENQRAGLPSGVLLDAKNRFTPDAYAPAYAAKGWKFRSNLKTGRFTARLLLPDTLSTDGTKATGRRVQIEGVLLSGQMLLARGFFLLPSLEKGIPQQSGAFHLETTE